MDNDTIVMTSTTQTQEQMDEALGKPKPVAPEPAPAKEAVAKAETPAGEEAGEPESKGEPGKKKGGWLRKIDRLESANEALQRQNQELMDQLAGKTAASPAPEASNAKPTSDQYKTYEEFIEALSSWTVRQETEKAQERTEAAAAELQAKEALDAFRRKAEEFEKTHEDFREVAYAEDVPLYDGVRQAIIEMENGPEVAYFLGSNREVADKLMEMTPLRAIAEVGRISQKLALPNPPAASAPPVKSPPAPLTPVSGASNTDAGDPKNWSLAEYRRRREAGTLG